jgi:signal transduction histidine kinase
MGISIQTKAFLGAAIGSGVALLNVFIVAQLMFVSTSHDLKLLIALIGFSAIVTVFFSLWAASTVAGRVDQVAGGIQALARGNYRARVEVGGGDEVSQLASDVNELAGRLEAAEEQRRALDRERRELTAAISHDLRTPLASVRAMVEALDDRVVQDEVEIERYYGTIRREIERLSRMIDDLFELAQLDAGALRLERTPLALDELASEVVDAMQAQANRQGVSLRLAATGDGPVVAVDGARMERAVGNLVRNALEHTPEGGRVEIGLFAKNGFAGLRVSDSGEGIDASDLPRVWERFYRAERSRRRSTNGADGAGLGLAIVKGIVEAHGGSVDVRSAPGRGATFTVRLPAAHE